MRLAVELVLWLAVAYVVTSAVEYFPHRYAMHSKHLARLLRSRALVEAFESHATLHHGHFFGPGRFAGCSDRAARHVSMKLGALYMLGMTWWLWGPLLLVSRTGGIMLALFLALDGVLWSAVHREMHFPAGGWLRRSALFRFWERYHEAHHERPGCNFNVILPLWDWLLGTYGGSVNDRGDS